MYGKESLKDKDMIGVLGRVDYCNNPSDAMPIIIENKISIIHKKNEGLWCAYKPFEFVEHVNFYRAAMELFLLMKDKENNND